MKEYIGELYERPTGSYERMDIEKRKRVESRAFNEENITETITHLKSNAAGDASGLDNRCMKALPEEVVEKSRVPWRILGHTDQPYWKNGMDQEHPSYSKKVTHPCWETTEC